MGEPVVTRWPLLAHRRVVTALAVVAVASGSGVAVPAARAAGFVAGAPTRFS